MPDICPTYSGQLPTQPSEIQSSQPTIGVVDAGQFDLPALQVQALTAEVQSLQQQTNNLLRASWTIKMHRCKVAATTTPKALSGPKGMIALLQVPTWLPLVLARESL